MPHSLVFSFTSEYFENTQNNNQWLQINPTVGKQVTIHQQGVPPDQKINAHGDIVGTDFTFKITDAITGQLQGSRSVEGGGVYGSFLVGVQGIITDALGSCPATGQLSGYFSSFGGGIG